MTCAPAAGGTNLDPKVDQHFHDMTFRFIWKERLETVIEDAANGTSTGEVTTLYQPKQ